MMRCNVNAILCSKMNKKKEGLIEIFLRCLLYMCQIYAWYTNNDNM